MSSIILQSDKEKRLIFSMMLSTILPLLDSSIINVILPDISKDTGISRYHIQWTVTGYMLACSAGILLSPFINKRAGVKVSWVYAMLIFLIGALLVGISDNIFLLITSRCIQGIGAGFLITVCQSILAIQFSKERLKSVMALIAIPAVFAPALGPLLGALISESVTWRMAFFINIPVIFISLFIGARSIPITDRVNEKINISVFFAFFISLVLIFVSIEGVFLTGDNTNYYSILLLIGVLCFIVSIVMNNRSPHKVIKLSQFNDVRYLLAIAMGFFTSFIFFGFLLFFPLLKTAGGDMATVYTGELLALQGAGAWVARKFIYKKLRACNPFFVIGAGLLVSAVSILIIEQGGTIFESIGFIVRGFGLGIATISSLSAPYEFSKKAFIYDTSAITRVTQQIGGALGGLLSGYLIYLTGENLITTYNSYQIIFFISLCCGLLAITAAIVIKRSSADN